MPTWLNSSNIFSPGSRAAVSRVMEAGRQRNSPATWAAVKILSDFVDSQDPGLPSSVLQSIIHLTEFLNMKLEEEEPPQLPKALTNKALEKFNKSQTNPTLSLTQMRIREQILKQKFLKQKKLKEIFLNNGSKKEKNEAPRLKITMKNHFPARIDLNTEKEAGKQLSFSTLPIY